MVVAMDNPSASIDQRRRSLLQVMIHVEDINDNDPVWPNVIAPLSTSETEKIGQTIGYVRATDKDTGPNGDVRLLAFNNFLCYVHFIFFPQCYLYYIHFFPRYG